MTHDIAALLEEIGLCADDPMWDAHCEIPKWQVRKWHDAMMDLIRDRRTAINAGVNLLDRAEKAEAERDALRAALKPFAEAIKRYDAYVIRELGQDVSEPDDEKVTHLGWTGHYYDMVTLGDFRAAMQATGEKTND